jgi:methylated-DNA-[protein]-cysteine S-methyltransferase
MMIVEIDRHSTPLGEVTLATREGALCAMTFSERWPRVQAAVARRVGGLEPIDARDRAPLRARLDAYFAGDLAALDSIAVDVAGTEFQRAVWAALRRIPAGETRSYGDLARALATPSAVRAVGAANGANPVWLVLPCHRVVGSDGALTGYAGGLARKRWLLQHEGTLPDAHSLPSAKEPAEAQSALF